MDNIENRENNLESLKNVPRNYNNDNCGFNNMNFPNQFIEGNLKNPYIDPNVDVQGVNMPEMNNKFNNNLNTHNMNKFISQSLKGGQGFNRSSNYGTGIVPNVIIPDNVKDLNYNPNKLNTNQNIYNNNKFNYNNPQQYTQNQQFNVNSNYNQMNNNYNNTKYTNNYNTNTYQVNNYFKYNGYYNFDPMKLKKTNDDYEIYLKDHTNHLKIKQNLESNNGEIFSNDTINVYNNELKVIEYNFPEMTYFKDLDNLDSILLKNIEKMSFEKFTPIQKTVIPLITDSYDIMGCSKTGSGKTAAFGIPIINLMLLRGPPKTTKIPSKIIN
jgi:hypothetical protein